MRKLIIATVVSAFTLVVGGTALAIPIYDPNLGYNRNIPIRSLTTLDSPQHGQFGDIELSDCMLVLDKPALALPVVDTPPRWPVQTRMYLQCDAADLLFTGYEWTFTMTRGFEPGSPVIATASGEDSFDSGPRVPARWGTKLLDKRWACKDVNPAERGSAQLTVTRGTITLFDTEGREYRGRVSDISYLTCPTL
jgi:hypothetical protein